MREAGVPLTVAAAAAVLQPAAVQRLRTTAQRAAALETVLAPAGVADERCPPVLP